MRGGYDVTDVMLSEEVTQRWSVVIIIIGQDVLGGAMDMCNVMLDICDQVLYNNNPFILCIITPWLPYVPGYTSPHNV